MTMLTTASRILVLTIVYTCVVIVLVMKNEQMHKIVVTPFQSNPDAHLSVMTQLGEQLQNVFKEKTLVLMWSDFYEIKAYRIPEKYIIPARKWDKDCCAGNVEVTADKNLLEKATTVVFFAYPGILKKDVMPKTRPKGQTWVLFLKESPTHTVGLSDYKSMFNWTMSYRRDSDIWAPYGEIVNLTSALSPHQTIQMPGGIPLNQWIHKKTKLMAWVCSNSKTNSKRELFKAALEKEGSNIIDVFGGFRGGIRICDRREVSCNHTKFWQQLAQTYHFYFAAENSLCTDYITEKFWRALDVGVVPVVYGGADYQAVAPPNSYIDVRDFESPKKLVDYLKEVARDKDLYGKYFEWKRTYTVHSTEGWKGWCELCRRTRLQVNNPLEDGVHSDVNAWWFRRPMKNSNGSTSAGKESACFKGPLVVTEDK